METNWITARLILAPIFTGDREHGHWSGLVVDREGSEQDSEQDLRVYLDSLYSIGQASADVRQNMVGTDIECHRDNDWVTADTPVQEPCSNDCGVWMCIGFASYLKSVSTDGADNPGNAQVTVTARLQRMSVREFGIQGRRHLLESLRNKAIDLNHPIIAALHVSRNI